MYAKIFQAILDSSLANDCATRHMFMDLLVLADPTGIVDMTQEAIARRLNVPLEVVQHELNKLEQPDKHSKSPEHGGRRIVRLDNHRDWGWQIVNYKVYNQFKDPEAKRSYFREYRRKTREAKKQCSPPVQPCSTPFKKNTPVAVAVAVTVTDTHTPKPPKPGLGDVSDFDKFYEAYPNQKAKADALKAWNQTEPGTKNAYPIKRPSLVDLLAAVEAQKVAGCLDGHDGGQWTPLPATWLRKGRWTDQNSSAPQAEPAIIPSWATLTEPPHA